MGQPTDFNDLLALYHQLEADNGPRKERRQHPRTSAKGHLPATIIAPGGAPVTASVKDLSRSGIGLFCPQQMRLGQLVDVEFQLGSGPVRATCRVVNCRPADGTRHVVGLAFVEVRRPAQPPPPPPVPTTLAPDDLPVAGEMLSAKEAMVGAEIGTVEEVMNRVSRMLRSS